MKVVYNAQIEDVVAFQRHYTETSPGEGRRVAQVVWLVPTSMLPVLAVALLSSAWVTAAVAAGLALLWAALIPSALKGGVEDVIHERYKEGAYRGAVGRTELEILPGRLVARHPIGEQTVPLEHIHRVVCLPEYAFIYISPVSAHPIHRLSVSDGDLDAFLDALEAGIAQAASPGAPGPLPTSLPVAPRSVRKPVELRVTLAGSLVTFVGCLLLVVAIAFSLLIYFFLQPGSPVRPALNESVILLSVLAFFLYLLVLSAANVFDRSVKVLITDEGIHDLRANDGMISWADVGRVRMRGHVTNAFQDMGILVLDLKSGRGVDIPLTGLDRWTGDTFTEARTRLLEHAASVKLAPPAREDFTARPAT